MERFLNDLSRACSELLPQQLSREFYAPVLGSLAGCFKEFEFEGEEYTRYLTASVESVVGFTHDVISLTPTTRGVFMVPLRTIIGDDAVLEALKKLARPFNDFYSLFRDTRYDRAIARTDDPKLRKEWDKRDEKEIEEYGFAAFYIWRELQQTPYGPHQAQIIKLFDTLVPYPMDETARFQHTWVISPTGTGKTTLLENLIKHDMDRIKETGGSIIVMDSQNQLIPKLASLVHPKEERLVLIEPTLEYPLAFNLFDNEAIDYANSLEIADFVFGGLLGAEMTDQQGGLFRHLALAMSVIPDATVYKLASLLEKDGYERLLRPHVHKLDDYSAGFFENRFSRDKDYNQSKAGIFRRLDTILSDPVFRKMFSAKRNRFKLADAIEKNKIVLVNTGKLKGRAKEAFGRFIIAMMFQAFENRLLRHPKPSPVHFYCDEADEYIAEEPLIGKMGNKVRKQGLAMTFSHTRMIDITNANVKDWLTTCRVKFAGFMTADAPFVAKHMHIEPEILMGLPDEAPYKFAFNQGKKTVVLECPPPIKHGPYSYEAHQKVMRERYCVPTGHDPLTNPKAMRLPDEPPPAVPQPPPRRRQAPADDIDL